MRDRLADMVALGIGPDTYSPGVWITNRMMLVINQFPDIQPIAKYPPLTATAKEALMAPAI
jgi:hypothetical protein